MTDHYTTSISARDLTSRLTTLQSSSSTNNNNDYDATTTTTFTNNGPRSSSTPAQRRARTSSFSSSSTTSLSHLPKFSKSSTMSTVDSTSTHGLRVSHAHPISLPSRASAQVAPGEFSKPRVNKRSRRDTGRSTKSESETGGKEMEFKYYGRHSNQWLFNDFSVTDAVAKGFKRVFGRERGEGDWFENREK